MFAERDPRSNVFILSSPLAPILITGLYLLLIYWLIPRHMKHRAAFKLDRFVIFYNVIQILTNLRFTYLGYLRWLTLNWHCTPIDYDDTPLGWWDLECANLFLLNKIIDLIDTIIFVLRKKSKQVTILHVFHHVMMVIGSWVVLVYWGGGQLTYIGIVNAVVHAVMYSYYLLTIWKPEQKNSLWWKKHITQLQFAQFAFFLVTFGRTLFSSSCTFPKSASAATVVGSLIMVILFGNFYYKTYVQQKKNQS